MRESRYNVWVEHAGDQYVFNGSSGELLRIPANEYAALQQYLAGDAAADCPVALVQKMAGWRMLCPEQADEVARLAYLYRDAREDERQLSVTILTSLGCNFACPYCFEAKHPSVMSAEVQAAVVRTLEYHLPQVESFDVVWFGGEPLLGKTALLWLSEQFTERCDRHSVPYSALIVTNGYLLDEATCAALRDARVERAQVTLDGPPAVHDKMRPLAGGQGTFRRIVENLKHAVDYLKVTVRMNINPDNLGDAEELFQILKAEGLGGRVSVVPGHLRTDTGLEGAPSCSYRGHCFTPGEFSRAQRAFFDLAVAHGFPAPHLPKPTVAVCNAVCKSGLVIGSEGELYKCLNCVGNPAEVVGNIRTHTVRNAREAEWLAYDPFQSEECRACLVLPICMGGCPLRARLPGMFSERCHPFRRDYREQILARVRNIASGAAVE